jgi:CheY-like chemotaxis protein
MNAILGWLSVLRSPVTRPDMVKKAMEVIHRNVMAQNQLIADLLDVSRIVTGKMSVETVPLDPAEPVEAALEAVRPAAEARGVALRPTLAEGLAVAADPDRLRQIVANLLTNAVKFTPAGGTVTVTLARTEGDARIEVTDTGEGIDPAFLPHVFERFRQADASHTRRYRGLGLGLAIARFLTEEHGGSLVARSEGHGRGSTFTVRLPLVAEAPVKGIRPRAVQQACLPGVRALVVEDEEDSRSIIALVLEQAGARVTAAASVAEALEALSAAPFDVVVSDIEMPDEDGYRLVAARRRDPLLSAVPVLALTAHAGESERARALAAGFATHIAKPPEEGELAAEVARVLHEKRQPPA